MDHDRAALIAAAADALERYCKERNWPPVGIATAAAELARRYPLEPKFPKMASGISCATYDQADRCINVILTEELQVFVMGADSGLTVVPHPTAPLPSGAQSLGARVQRVGAAPVIVNLPRR